MCNSPKKSNFAESIAIFKQRKTKNSKLYEEIFTLGDYNHCDGRL